MPKILREAQQRDEADKLRQVLENLYDRDKGNYLSYKIVCIEEEGGEDQGTDAHRVYSVTDAEGNIQYIKVDISYYSYEGFNWDGWEENCYEVVMKPVLVNTWVNKNDN